MEHDIIIRPATEADAPAIHELTFEAFTKYSQDLGRPVAALSETVEDVIADMRRKRIFVGLLDGRTVGSVRYELLGELAYFGRFGVTQSCQNVGMGRKLVHAVLEDCRARGIKAIALHTSSRMAALMRFYYGCGFFVHSTATDRGYIRALLVCELGTGEYDLTPVMGY